ncbi:MAG TPA: xanthine dehydrogenase family protein molybdopterin-binding subunit [Candidatus Angelobacter sp.]|nr:xanthine dehydrogenase family protein molybdopterin-binding subunit [Candidatus Angelobacter sp.]
MLHNPIRNIQPTPSRRHFLIGATATGAGLVVGYYLLGRPAGADTTAPAAPINPFAGYVQVGADNKVTVLSAHMDMGQGCYNGIATLVAEELNADWGQMDVIGGAGNPLLYGNLTWGGKVQGTGGSSAIASSFERYRRAGATARAMLVAAAAEDWQVPVGEIAVDKGVLTHASGKRASFGDLAAKAATMPVPTDLPLKDAAQWTLIGNEKLPRYDSLPKSTGKQDYTLDVKLPGMLTAVMIHPPLFGSVVKSFDASKAKAVKGVVDVVATPRGLAVVADNMWAAIKGREQVTVEWDDSKAEKRGSAELVAQYNELAKKPGTGTARNDGDIDHGFAAAAKVLEASFEFPYLAHAALEPLNAVARLNADGTLEVWGGHQMPDLYQAVAAQIAGLTPDKVTLHVLKTGGSFGRRATPDSDVIVEAVAVAKALGGRAPVKVQWTREDDMKGGRYRPLYVHTLKAGLDAQGNLVAWRNHIVGQSILAGTPFGGLIQNGIDLTSVEGAANIPYAIPNLRVELTTTEVGVPVLWWRSVGSTHTAYAVEAFIDEVAEAAGKDPVDFRLALLKDHPRHIGVLKLAAEKAGWGTPAAAGRFRGIAVAESFNTYVAQVAEVSVAEGGHIKVERVVCAVDCGTAINPDQVRAQMEGGIGFGLGAILKSQLTLTNGAVDQANFDSYDVLRINEMPQVEVHIVPSQESPTGVGEPGVPPIGPAVANAVYSATKKRIRVLPFARNNLTTA